MTKKRVIALTPKIPSKQKTKLLHNVISAFKESNFYLQSKVNWLEIVKKKKKVTTSFKNPEDLGIL